MLTRREDSRWPILYIFKQGKNMKLSQTHVLCRTCYFDMYVVTVRRITRTYKGSPLHTFTLSTFPHTYGGRFTRLLPAADKDMRDS
jgi:hypothetical protein